MSQSKVPITNSPRIQVQGHQDYIIDRCKHDCNWSWYVRVSRSLQSLHCIVLLLGWTWSKKNNWCKWLLRSMDAVKCSTQCFTQLLLLGQQGQAAMSDLILFLLELVVVKNKRSSRPTDPEFFSFSVYHHHHLHHYDHQVQALSSIQISN